MKRLLAILILISFNFPYFAQKAYTFVEAGEKNLRTSAMDSLYKSAIGDSTAVFKTEMEQEAVINGYIGLLQDLGEFLYKNDFKWEKSTKGFNRIYFNASGKIDYFIYSFRPEQLTPEQEKRFGELLSLFIAGYQFPLSASQGFAQCSPVTYQPKAN